MRYNYKRATRMQFLSKLLLLNTRERITRVLIFPVEEITRVTLTKFSYLSRRLFETDVHCVRRTRDISR